MSIEKARKLCDEMTALSDATDESKPMSHQLAAFEAANVKAWQAITQIMTEESVAGCNALLDSHQAWLKGQFQAVDSAHGEPLRDEVLDAIRLAGALLAYAATLMNTEMLRRDAAAETN